MPFLQTSGDRWMTNHGGACWVKLIRHEAHTDLSQRYGRSLTADFDGFNRDIMMDEGHKLIVAGSKPSDSDPNPFIVGRSRPDDYDYKLIESNGNQLYEVSRDVLYRATYLALDKGGIIPPYCTPTAMQSWLYMAAVYCVMSFRGLMTYKAEPVVPAIRRRHVTRLPTTPERPKTDKPKTPAAPAGSEKAGGPKVFSSLVPPVRAVATPSKLTTRELLMKVAAEEKARKAKKAQQLKEMYGGHTDPPEQDTV